MRLRHDDHRERGQALVLFSLFLVVILAFAAIVIDLAVLRNNRQILFNALDAGTLAGGYDMPIDGTAGTPATVATVEALIRNTIDATYPGLQPSSYQITYRCVIGVDPGTSNAFASRDIPLVCDPHYSLGTTVAALAANPSPYFRGAGDTRSSSCDPTAGDKCNTIVVTGAATTQFAFGPVVGVNSGSRARSRRPRARGRAGRHHPSRWTSW